MPPVTKLKVVSDSVSGLPFVMGDDEDGLVERAGPRPTTTLPGVVVAPRAARPGGPNLPRPMISAPTVVRAIPRGSQSSRLTSPPSLPWGLAPSLQLDDPVV